MSNWRANNDPPADFIHMLYADDDKDLSEDSEFEPDDDELDLSYKVSHNPYTQRRALRILQPGTELTGNYMCVVSTFLAEGEKTRPMTIFGKAV
ncbi:unnamed protein product [Parnassius apollo]|uniref:(apollo) hypothetical protein n=1 Tax=Parnassius apollo TaxID=110799 RepID=A0A8S3XBM7_PARAO|nr:unnamed protein product [Parnassius apollo]